MTTSSGISAACALTMDSAGAVPAARTVRSACRRISALGLSEKRPFDSATLAALGVAMMGTLDRRNAADDANNAPSSTSHQAPQMARE